ncbi:Rossmann-like and DUF2520 domain-containing protein [Nocardioides alkalitolerans]|uniref:Rossmann-like and DUF2520 domain-containing protein n=1 Tax=Nocardioides alkalitolerans TaxID=281714 RepID=UPI0004086CF4|nr:DUF2520 domain-containing protein [Nocardioides alkalitolerans]
MSTDMPCSALRIGIVGAGRVGAVLGRALADAGHEIVAVAGESDASVRRADALLPGVPRDKPSAVARACDVLLLTVPDDMLVNVASMLAASGSLRPGQHVVHTSGAHGLAALASVVETGAVPVALHPAMTFTGTATDLPRVGGCAYGVTAAPAGQALADRLVADLGGRTVRVAEDRRALYHAALAHGSNHLVTLVAEAMEMLAAVAPEGESAGSADPADVLRPLLAAALDNALRSGDAALTGPVVRGDVGTVEAHLGEIAAEAPQALGSYVALARATTDRATTDGRLLPIRAARMLRVLDATENQDATTTTTTTEEPTR